jgi:hypothetical protein
LVDRITVKAMLCPAALLRLSALEHRFCPAPDCPVVYFGHDEVFDRDEIVVPVFQKEPTGERTVCYCFAISEREIRTELIRTGRSSASERIGASRTASAPTRKRVSFSRTGWSALLSGRSRGDSSAGSATGIGRRDAAPNSD